ncbi:MAG: M23 family metallopeptidase, partial [Oscillospiraceae bacterium]|nr:M23 family metallopeptidase [Oscillospiraceae bacterium]
QQQQQQQQGSSGGDNSGSDNSGGGDSGNGGGSDDSGNTDSSDSGNTGSTAGSGTVITASSDGGYGNYVIIDHGNYTQTLYAHMSYIGVSAGTYVSQGQVIGGLGSTGRSTGTHCHYEIFVNGDRTDPAAYYSGLSYWNC